jgi:hypothetical protein
MEFFANAHEKLLVFKHAQTRLKQFRTIKYKHNILKRNQPEKRKNNFI